MKRQYIINFKWEDEDVFNDNTPFPHLKLLEEYAQREIFFNIIKGFTSGKLHLIIRQDDFNNYYNGSWELIELELNNN
jgi:hypothetical protein